MKNIKYFIMIFVKIHLRVISSKTTLKEKSSSLFYEALKAK